jgi:hypothetical protein
MVARAAADSTHSLSWHGDFIYAGTSAGTILKLRWAHGQQVEEIAVNVHLPKPLPPSPAPGASPQLPSIPPSPSRGELAALGSFPPSPPTPSPGQLGSPGRGSSGSSAQLGSPGRSGGASAGSGSGTSLWVPGEVLALQYCASVQSFALILADGAVAVISGTPKVPPLSRTVFS